MLTYPYCRDIPKLLRLICAVALAGGSISAHAQADEKEPIAYIGHGAMFDQGGMEIRPSLKFITDAQAWYRQKLLGKVTAQRRFEFQRLEQPLTKGLALDPQSKLVSDSQLLDWLVSTGKSVADDRTRGKLKLVQQLLRDKISDAPDISADRGIDAFKIHQELGRRLKAEPKLLQKGRGVRALIADPALDYDVDCANHGVPNPPNWGASWVSAGVVGKADLFIARSLDAEVFTYTSASPPGVCVALPRFNASGTVQLDGIICLGQSDTTVGNPNAKACFWDNQDAAGNAFTFPRTSPPNISNWRGGLGLVGGSGGVCTDCHAGENPYIIHGTVLSSIPTSLRFSPTRHDPIVGATWPQNPGPMNSPPTCVGCHDPAAGSPGWAGRFPHLSVDLPGYCGSVLRPSVGAMQPPASGVNLPSTMPPGAEGSLACTPGLSTGDVRFRACNATHTIDCTPAGGSALPANKVSCTPELAALLNWCGAVPSSDGESRGDPHVRTVNGINYDFQSAGEFVYLRSASGLEIHTRQTPVATAFPVGPNHHTGLTSCVSVNTAVAARVGSSRVTFQPNLSGKPDPSGMQLRVDGALVKLTAAGLTLSGGGTVTRTAIGGGIEVKFPDKSRMIVTPGWWGDQSIWFLNVDVLNTPANEGVMGAIRAGNWLSALPDGTTLGAIPASLHQRYVDLNQKFADAWRVNSVSSLFDYAPGTSSSTFTNASWPPENPPCIIRTSTAPVAKGMPIGRAKEWCNRLGDRATVANCVTDLAATGEPAFLKAYQISEQLKKRAREKFVLGNRP